MKTLGFIGSWFFGVFAAFSGLTYFSESFLAALLFLLAAGFLLPPIRNFTGKKTKIDLSPGVRAVIVFPLFIIAAGIAGNHESSKKQDEIAALEREQAEIALVEEKAKAEYFSLNRDSIIASIKQSMKEKNYSAALVKAQDYESQNDPELNRILVDVRSILDKQQAKIRAEQEAWNEKNPDFGPMPTKSAWNGSYTIVERYLKNVANDPSSIKMDGCSDPRKAQTGWVVRCNYRGKNAFGGLIRQTNWFVIRDNRVLLMLPADAYQ